MSNTLLKLRKSRKAFLVEYICGFFLLGIVLLMVLKNYDKTSYLFVGMVLATLFIFLSVEMMRIMTRYSITKTKIIIIHGLIKQLKKNVYYHPLAFVPDLNVKQSRLDRLLDIGTVYLKGGGNENTFELKDISNPHRALEMIENLIDDNQTLKKVSN
jgi:uncharacterized membrane protein YdbT with pleckstrin-like domain